MKKTKKVKIERLFGRQYLSDKPCWDDPKHFQGAVTLITAGTGSGKSTAMLNIAGDEDYLGKNEKMLFMTTRRADAAKLRAKVEKEGLTYKVDVKTVQSFEEAISVYDMDGAAELARYKIVVCDEAHYWTTDTSFSESAILSYESVKAFADTIEKTDKMLFLISATPERLSEIFPVKWCVNGDIYTDHIRNVIFVPDEDYIMQAAMNIGKAIENGSKGIIFVRKKTDMEKILTEIGVQAERVETYTAEKRPMCDEYGEFKIPDGKSIIIATSVLAFGVDFWDDGIQFVMSNECDPVLVVQELGRRRCFGEKEVDYYVADFTADYLNRAYAKYKKFYEDAALFESEPEKFYGAGGVWYEGIFRHNRIFRIERHTTVVKMNPTFKSFCMRHSSYSDDISEGNENWQNLVMTRLGFKQGTYAPVKPYQDVIANDVKTMLAQMEATGVLTTDDWKLLGKALRAKNQTHKGKGTNYKHGDYLSSPKKIDSYIRPYGYKAGEVKKKQVDGKRINYYPLIRLNDAERDGE